MKRNERRLAPRVALTEQVHLIHQDHVLPLRETRDIGEGGLSIERVDLPQATPLRIYIPLPRENGKRSLVFAQGEIAWSDETHTGVRFVEPSAETVTAVRELLRAAS